MEQLVNLKINGTAVTAPRGTTILEAARSVQIEIPTLCFLKDINEIGACRMCIVEVKGVKKPSAACVYPVEEGMEVFTNTPEVIQSRKMTLELLLSNHRKDCLSCVRNGSCELQTLCHELGVTDETLYQGSMTPAREDVSAIHMVRDNSKCILCRRCTAVCEKEQAVGVIGAQDRGFETYIGSPFDMGLGDTSCVSCGQCINVCPVGALYEKDATFDVLDEIADPSKFVVVQTAPSVRVGLGEEFGYPIGTNVEGQMVSVLRRLGFDKVFDTDFGADMTIVEEATEFINRVKNGGVLPMFTSCSPGWVKYCETYYPDLIPHLSSCKSPAQMFGATLKTYYADKFNIDPAKIVCVSVMPCTAKKFEIKREDENASGYPDVDYSITTRELARMIKRVGLRFQDLPEEDFDHPLGESTGAGTIFGATGGVMEAALRTAVEVMTGENLQHVDFVEVRGTKGIKEATYKVNGEDIKIAVASGLTNAQKIMEKVRSGEADYHFVEIMACPGGCVNGGGQPIQSSNVRNFTDIKKLRAAGLYSEDEAKQYRKSHQNRSLLKVYDDFFDGEFGSHKAHEILHTSFKARPIR